MSRTAEDQQLLEERIQRMKQKNEELRRRHLEVEADKQSAAKQNALVKMSVPHDDDWIPGRHDNNPRQDRRHHNTEPSAANNYERSDERGQGFDSHRSWNENSHRDDSYYCQVNESAPHSRASQNSQNYAGKRNDHQGSRHRSDGDRYYHGHDNRQPGDWSGPGRSQDRGSYRSKERTSHSNRDYRNSGPSQSGEGSMNYSSTFPSKVFKNSSMESERGKRFSHRLAEGDGPPPDPSFSFLTDSMRDSQESAEKRKEFNSRRGFTRGRGRGGQSWNNRGYSNSRHDGFDARQETHNRPTDDAWRRERSLIDQERINRQKTSDGSWSREWDNNKVFQENDRTNRWKRGNQVQNYDRGYSQRGHFNNRDQRQNFAPKNDTVSVEDTPGAPELDESPPRSKFIRRGRFSSQNKVKDNSKVTNGVAQLSPSAVEHPNKIQNVCVEENTKTVENLQVSLVCDPSGAQKRCVEDLGGNLRISVSTDGDAHESTSAEIPHQRKIRKAKRNRILSSTSTGTTGTAGEDDESWEDLSTDEDVSVVHELGKRSYLDTGLGKSVDVSSGPESLDPIPAPGKEDEFLWDDFHPAGFQDNAAVGLDTEAAFKALLDEKSKQEDCLAEESFQSPKVSFRLDTSCLEDSGDDGNVTKLDPLLVTTQIVQAEVDCMSLTSIPTDSSLPEDITQLCKIISSEDGTTPEEDGVPCIETIVSHPIPVSAEEPSGPISVGDGFEPEPSEEAAKELCVVTENCDIKKTTENLHNDEENHPTNLTEQENKDPLEYALKQVGNTSDSHEQDSISNGEKGEVEIVERNRSSPSQSVKQSETSELNEISLSTESNDSRPENSPPNCDDGNAVHKKDVISVT